MTRDEGRSGERFADEGVTERSWRALGTGASVLVLDGDGDAASVAVAGVLDAIDRACSSFREDSELVALNRASGTWVEVSPLLGDALVAALRAARLTDGLCDPTVGRALHRIGYDEDFARVAARTDPIELRMERVPGWRTIELDAPRRRLRAPAGVVLDLGSIGKAFAADRAVLAALEGGAARGALVSLGGDVAMAGEPPVGGWRILATDDSNVTVGGAGDVVAVSGGAVATSGTSVRRWRRGQLQLHHLIDPRTGMPAVSPWRTVSAVAGTCVEANAASTAALILGDEGPGWVAARGLAGRFVRHDGSVVRVGGWPAPGAAS